jgi:hypothetical protein
MANYKKLETLVKNFADTTDEMYDSIIDNAMVDVSELSDREKFSVLIFAELARALGTKDMHLELDCNYLASKFHNHEDEADDVYKVDYYRLVPASNANSTLIQFYVKPNIKAGQCLFDLCTSCAKANREQFQAMESELGFTVKYDKKTGRAKTSGRGKIPYDQVVDVVKAVLAVLSNTEAESKSAKAVRKEQKPEEEDGESED